MTLPLTTRRLRDDVHAVAIADDAVFLDVERDTYVCVPNVADRLLVDDAGRVEAILEHALAHDLDQAGLLASAGAARPPPRWPVEPAAASALQGPFEPVRSSDVLRGARALADLSRAYWRQPLSGLVAWAEAGATGAGSAPPTADLLGLVQAFHRWGPYVPAPGKCLLRSFMLLRLLRRHGHDARWVFGVRTWPFRAHCWLQRGDVVLDDDVEALAPLTPILVL